MNLFLLLVSRWVVDIKGEIAWDLCLGGLLYILMNIGISIYPRSTKSSIVSGSYKMQYVYIQPQGLDSLLYTHPNSSLLPHTPFSPASSPLLSAGEVRLKSNKADVLVHVGQSCRAVGSQEKVTLSTNPASSTAVGVSHPFSEQQPGPLFLHSPEKMVLCITFGLKEDSCISLCPGTSRFTVKGEAFYGNQSMKQMTTPSTREQLLGDTSMCFKKKQKTKNHDPVNKFLGCILFILVQK